MRGLTNEVIILANKIESSKIGTGTKQLISDLTKWLTILAPIVGAVCIAYFLVRKGMSDEMDHKKWNTRTTVAIISTVGAVLAAVIVNLVVSYYQ